MTANVPGYSAFAIAPQESGLYRNRDVFLIPDDAYAELVNMYIWRGRLKRRLGYSQLGRLERQFTSISYFDSGASPWSFNLLTISGYVSTLNIAGAPTIVVTTTAPHGLSNGDNVVFSNVGGTVELNGNTYTVANVTTSTFEVTQAGPSAFTSGGFWFSNQALTAEPDASVKPGSFSMTIDPGGTPEVITDNGDCTLTGSIAATGTINYATGAVTITGAAGSVATTMSLAYYPGLPVMGIRTREIPAINAEATIAFDTVYAYQYSNANSRWQEFIGGTKWTGNNSQFFWSTNYWQDANNNEIFWATNYKIDGTIDPIRYTNSIGWTTFNPTTNGSNELYQARILVPYKGRLVALRTFEGADSATGVEYPQRARWSQLGDPTDQTNGWRDDIRGRGGWVEAATNEYIQSAAFIGDLLVVQFERSTWALRYSGNELQPFYWDRINIELGAKSTFSEVQFDRAILGIADKAIVQCDGNSVTPIDAQIPDEVFEIHNQNNGPLRVHGIRDFKNRLVYWTFPNDDENGTYPNRVLVYNYENQSYAFFTDSFTCYGTWQRFNDLRWQDLTDTTWTESTFPWDSPINQSGFPSIIAGNQQGFTFVLNTEAQNASSRQIKSFTLSTGANDPLKITSPNHNLQDGDWIYITGVNESVSGNLDIVNGRVFNVARNTADILNLYEKPRYAITNITQATQAVVTAAGHVSQVGDEYEFTGVTGMTEINNRRGRVTAVSGTTFTVDINSTAFTAYGANGSAQNLSAPLTEVNIQTGTYCGGGEFAHIMNISAASKKFNALDNGGQPRLGFMDVLTNTTADGEVGIEMYASYADGDPVNPEPSDGFYNTYVDTQASTSAVAGTGKEWKRFYSNLVSDFVQYRFRFNERQMASYTVNSSQLEIGAIVLYMARSGRLAR